MPTPGIQDDGVFNGCNSICGRQFGRSRMMSPDGPGFGHRSSADIKKFVEMFNHHWSWTISTGRPWIWPRIEAAKISSSLWTSAGSMIHVPVSLYLEVPPPLSLATFLKTKLDDQTAEYVYRHHNHISKDMWTADMAIFFPTWQLSIILVEQLQRDLLGAKMCCWTDATHLQHIDKNRLFFRGKNSRGKVDFVLKELK